jgi:hypothetical protein
MEDQQYQKAIDKIKEEHPQFKDLRFEICNGELSYFVDSRYPRPNMIELQKFVNSFLGQKVYRTEWVSYIDVYARSEEEAKLFTKYINPKPIMVKVIETDFNQLVCWK